MSELKVREMCTKLKYATSFCSIKKFAKVNQEQLKTMPILNG